MPILLTPIVHKSLVHGHTWEVVNEQLLAELIAQVALGQARHVSKILLSIGPGDLPIPLDDAWSAAERMLTVPAGIDHWHRDGWMFQVMSWLSALKAGTDSLINTPQMIFAQKGFDGIQLDFDPAGAISAVVIFEDKATENPRETIRELVWPEFKEYESGGDANVLLAEVIGLLEKRPGVDVDDVVNRVIWKDARHFRVSTTVGDSHATDAGRGRLFKGYDQIIPGDIKRRRGETFYTEDLRVWMDSMASKVLAHITTLKAAHV
jgi:hypothetical protein